MNGIPVGNIGAEIINRHIFEGANAWPALADEINALAVEAMLLREVIKALRDEIAASNVIAEALIGGAIDPTAGLVAKGEVRDVTESASQTKDD